LRGGWSSHLEFQQGAVRVRTDFFTRPPRISSEDLEELWRDQEGKDPPFTGPRILLEIKKTAREKDWPFVGELARLLNDPKDQMRCSRSAHDLIALDAAHPALALQLSAERPALQAVPAGLQALREALDRERREAMDADDRRIRSYIAAASGLEQAWPEVRSLTAGRPLPEAHSILVDWAERCLPKAPDIPPAISS
jgi:hypothetical protein